MPADVPDTDLGSMLTIGQAAATLGVSVPTLRNWDRQGKLVPVRHPVSGYRLYPRRLIARLKGSMAAEAVATYAAAPGAEQRFDVPFVARLSVAEKQIQQAYRPYIQVHKWFARRPGSLFRALLLAEFGDGPSLAADYFRPHSLPHYTVFDPFMGGGTPVLEANRLGMSTVGCDVNPMAHWIVRQELEVVDLPLLRERSREVIGRAEEQLGGLYRTRCRLCGSDAPVKYFIWAKLQTCGGCGRDFELLPGYLIAKNARHPNFVFFCPVCRGLFELPAPPARGEQVRCGECGNQFLNDGVAARSRYVCPYCAHAGRYPQELAAVGPPRHSLMCMEYHCPRCRPKHAGRFFASADATDVGRYREAARRWRESPHRHFAPQELIPEGDETTRLLRWGYRRFADMFNERQLLGLTTLCHEVTRVEDRGVRHALATVLSDCLRYQNMLARYDTYALKCQDIFAVHGFPVGLVQCENNLLGIERVGSGGFRHVLAKYVDAKRYCARPFEKRATGARKVRVSTSPERIEARLVSRMPQPGEGRTAWLACDSSEHLNLPPASVDAVLTDPPYFDNVQYAELMDFCYVWLSRLLQQDVPHFANGSTRNASELTGNKSAGRDIMHFAQGLSDIYCAAARALKPYGLFAFTYHHNDLAAYVPVVVALCDAGLSVTAALPCPAEMGASLHISGTGSSIVDTVLCSRRVGQHARLPEQGGGADDLRSRLSEQARALRRAGVGPTEGDLKCMALGILTAWAVNGLSPDWRREASLAERLRSAEGALADLARHSALDEAVGHVLHGTADQGEGSGQQVLF
jgi:putative DNA methylase